MDAPIPGATVWSWTIPTGTAGKRFVVKCQRIGILLTRDGTKVVLVHMVSGDLAVAKWKIAAQ